jgi:hypothetical protein
VLLFALLPQTVRADTTFELLPTATVGVTTNATAVVNGARDEFAILAALGRLQYRGARSTFNIGYRLGYTKYFQGNGTDTLVNELLGQSSFELARGLELRLNAGAILSRTSQLGTLGLLLPQASATGSAIYLATTAGQEVSYDPTPRWRLTESFTYTRVDYLFADPAPNRRPSTSLTGGGRVDWMRALDTYSFDVRITNFLLGPVPGTATTPALPEGSMVLGQALLGWRRELSIAWSAELQAGAAYLSNGPNADLYVPAGIATLGYRWQTWFATLQASQVPVANLFQAFASVNDQASVRLVLPLDKRELMMVAATGALIYARASDAQGNLSRAYDQQTAGARVSARHDRLPFAAALEYQFIHQNGGPGVGVPVGDLIRHVFMLHITGAFSWGPGTPPLLEGGRLTMPER